MQPSIAAAEVSGGRGIGANYRGRLFCRSYIVAVSSMTSRRFWWGILGGKKDSDICEAARQEENMDTTDQAVGS